MDVGLRERGRGRLFLENWLIPQWSFTVLKMWFRTFSSTEFDVGVLRGMVWLFCENLEVGLSLHKTHTYLKMLESQGDSSVSLRKGWTRTVSVVCKMGSNMSES